MKGSVMNEPSMEFRDCLGLAFEVTDCGMSQTEM